MKVPKKPLASWMRLVARTRIPISGYFSGQSSTYRVFVIIRSSPQGGPVVLWSSMLPGVEDIFTPKF